MSHVGRPGREELDAFRVTPRGAPLRLAEDEVAAALDERFIAEGAGATDFGTTTEVLRLFDATLLGAGGSFRAGLGSLLAAAGGADPSEGPPTTEAYTDLTSLAEDFRKPKRPASPLGLAASSR